MPARKRGLAVLVVAAALHGCGGSDETENTNARPNGAVGGDQRAILETIDTLQRASRRGASLTICTKVFTPELARSIEKASRTKSCPAEVRESLFRPNQSFSVGRVIEVDGNTATAVIREQNGDVSTLHMLKREGRWRINRVRPRDAS